MHRNDDNPVGGIRVMEDAGEVSALVPVPAGVVAFVGRTRRGPVNQPVAVRSFAEFERVFGGLWQPAPLGHAVAHFFANGGIEARVVRIAKGARPASLRLPTGEAGLDWVLHARQPGTREFLRAAVDHDGLGADETEEFNLLVQRVRTPGGEVVEAQEVYPRVSAIPGTPRFLGDLLADSALVTATGPWPSVRPAPTPPRTWAMSRPDGDDGEPPGDHDLIGDRDARTGLHALNEGGFQWLVLPPPARDRSHGALVWWVAARFCGERQAMLLIDPPAAWDGPEAAQAGMADWPLRTPDAAMWFPWIETLDPLRGITDRFPPSGAVAGLLSRQESLNPPSLLSSSRLPLPPLRPGFGLAQTVTTAQRERLGAAGLNVPSTVRVPRGRCPPQVTLAPRAARLPATRQLLAHRRWQSLVAAMLRGTRWVLFRSTPPGPALWRPVARQVVEWLSSQTDLPSDAALGWFVVCDARLNPPETPPGTVRFLFGLAGAAGTAGAAGAGGWQATLVEQAPQGSRVCAVSPNAWALPHAPAQPEADSPPAAAPTPTLTGLAGLAGG